MKRNPINQYNLRSNSKQTNTPSSSLDDAHWNDDIDDDDNIEFRTNSDDDIYNDARIYQINSRKLHPEFAIRRIKG